MKKMICPFDDLVTYEEFCAQEDAEMYPDSDDPFVVNMSGVRDVADIHIQNTFPSEPVYRAHLVDAFEL